jgi:hypothetical protein
MAKEQLHASQVPGSPIDQRWLGMPDRVRSVPRPVKAGLLNPAVHNTGVLARAEVRRRLSFGEAAIVAVLIGPRRTIDGRPRRPTLGLVSECN